MQLFTDGSALGVQVPALARAGWAVVAVRPGTYQLLYAAYGHVPRRWAQTSGAGEMLAFAWAVRLQAFGPDIATDYQHILLGLSRGREWCTAPERRYADVWQLLWHLVEDRGCAAGARKVKGHARWDPLLPHQEQVDRFGNVMADVFCQARGPLPRHRLAAARRRQGGGEGRARSPEVGRNGAAGVPPVDPDEIAADKEARGARVRKLRARKPPIPASNGGAPALR